MSSALNGSVRRELSVVGLYRELTGASESMARSVYIHVCCREESHTPLPEAGMLGREELLPGSLALSSENARDWFTAPGWELRRKVCYGYASGYRALFEFHSMPIEKRQSALCRGR